MRFSTLSATLALVLSVNAAAFNKRDVTAATQTCIDDLEAVSSQLTTVYNGVSSYTASDGYIGALSVQSEESTLESDLKTAETDCCAVSTPVSDDDANAVIAEIAVLVPQIQDTLAAIVNQKSVFDSVALVTSLVTTDLKNLQSETYAVMDCLLAAVPSDLADTAQSYTDEVTAAFEAADTAYGISSS